MLYVAANGLDLYWFCLFIIADINKACYALRIYMQDSYVNVNWWQMNTPMRGAYEGIINMIKKGYWHQTMARLEGKDMAPGSLYELFLVKVPRPLRDALDDTEVIQRGCSCE